jgi:hypothetical protein
MRRARAATAGPWRRVLAAGAVLAALLAAGERRGAAAPTVVSLTGPAGSRLADELARELTVAGLAVARAEVEVDAARATIANGVSYGLVVTATEETVVLLARRAPGGAIQTRIEMNVDPRDRLARRRACLAAVEYLRVLTDATHLEPREARTPAATEPATAGGVVAARLVAAPIPPTLAKTTAATTTTTTAVATTTRTAASPGGSEPPPTVRAIRIEEPSSPRHGWALGVASMLDLSTAFGETTSHLAFLWRFPLRNHLAIRARGLWPLLGAQVHIDDRTTRAWSFGATADLQYLFGDPGGPVSPFVGASVGVRVLLSDSDEPTAPSGPSPLTPSGTLGLQAGIAWRVSGALRLLVEVEVDRDRRMTIGSPSPEARMIADATSLHSSVGALFDY